LFFFFFISNVETYWHAVNERKWGSHSFVQERERERKREERDQETPEKREKAQARASVVAVVY
jgi:hypothetical protein